MKATNVQVKGDGEANFVTIVDDGNWIARVQFNGEFYPHQQIEMARKMAASLQAETFDLIAHLHRQREFSMETFGPGTRLQGLMDHIRKELKEIEAKPEDLEEWIDLILLSLDGAWRAGFEPEEIADAIEFKQTKNEGRDWPDWRTADRSKAIEHVRTDDAEAFQRDNGSRGV